MYEPELRDFFSVDKCERCGKCLSSCPDPKVEIADPESAINSLVRGVYAKQILERCSACMTCSAACPNGCNPYGLILYRWHQRARRKGIPVRASLLMPLEKGNAWQKVMDRLPRDEARLLATWSDLERPVLQDGAVFAGCNLQILPYLSRSSLFDGLAIFGSPDLCCGEVYYRMGLFDTVKSISDNLQRQYERAGFKRLIAYCQACYNVLGNILPRHFGARFPFELSYFGDLVTQKALSGELPVAGRLEGMTVTVQDPCHSKLIGGELQTNARKVLEHMGCRVLEMRHNRETALCCGLGHGAARYNPLDMAGGVVRRLREARATGADRLVVYCNSCELLFSAGTQITPFIIPVYHLNELVSEAVGENLDRRNLARARSMMFELFVSGAPKVVSRRRLHVPVS